MTRGPQPQVRPTLKHESVLRLHYRGFGHSEIGRQLGMLRQQVGQIIRRWLPDTPKGRQARPILPSAVVEEGRRLWMLRGEEYLTTSQIADALQHLRPGMTKNAVVGMAHRNKFPPRASPIIR